MVICRIAWLTPRLDAIPLHWTHFLSIPHLRRSWLFIPPEAQVHLNCHPHLADRAASIRSPSMSPEPANEDYVNTRWDYVLSESNTIFGRYVFDNGSLVDPTVSPRGLYPESQRAGINTSRLAIRKSFPRI